MKRFMKEQKGAILAPWMLLTAFAVITGAVLVGSYWDVITIKFGELTANMSSWPTG